MKQEISSFILYLRMFGVTAGFPALLGGGASARAGLAASALAAAFAGRLLVDRLSSSGAGLLTAAGHLVDRSPGAALSFVLRYASLLVAFLDMLCLPLLLGGVSGFISTWHGLDSLLYLPIEEQEKDGADRRQVPAPIVRLWARRTGRIRG